MRRHDDSFRRGSLAGNRLDGHSFQDISSASLPVAAILPTSLLCEHKDCACLLCCQDELQALHVGFRVELSFQEGTYLTAVLPRGGRMLLRGGPVC